MNGAKCITYRMRIKKSTHEDANRAVISSVVGVERLGDRGHLEVPRPAGANLPETAGPVWWGVPVISLGPEVAWTQLKPKSTCTDRALGTRKRQFYCVQCGIRGVCSLTRSYRVDDRACRISPGYKTMMSYQRFQGAITQFALSCRHACALSLLK